MARNKQRKGKSGTGRDKRVVRWGMVIDLRRCLGCQSCMVACKAENGVPLGVWRTWVKQVEKGRFPHVSKSFLPSLCNNCERPICNSVCPVRATYVRPDGIVMVDPHRCIGCKYCIAACPYEVRYVDPIKKIVQKCFWCQHRIDAGLKPACVAACIGGARIFGDLNDPESEVARLLATKSVQVLKADKGTDPQVYYISLDMAVVTARKEHSEWNKK